MARKPKRKPAKRKARKAKRKAVAAAPRKRTPPDRGKLMRRLRNLHVVGSRSLDREQRAKHIAKLAKVYVALQEESDQGQGKAD